MPYVYYTVKKPYSEPLNVYLTIPIRYFFREPTLYMCIDDR